MPVIGIDGALVGIISATDFIGKRVDAEVVGELKSSPVATADPADIVPAAARTLLARNVRDSGRSGTRDGVAAGGLDEYEGPRLRSPIGVSVRMPLHCRSWRSRSRACGAGQPSRRDTAGVMISRDQRLLTGLRPGD